MFGSCYTNRGDKRSWGDAMRIFISYAREEKSFVSGFADLLRTEGYDPWYDGDLPGGDDWKEKIYREIEKCLILIYVLTPASSTSIWCNHEVAHARSKKKRIIPVQLKPAPIPEPIAQLHCFDITAFASEPLTTIAPLVEQLARISRRRFWRALAAVLILFAVLATIILGGLALYSRPLVVADFNNCAVTNNVGGALNTAFGSDSSIQYEFMEDSSGGGCMAKLSYTLGEWSA